MKWPSVKLKSVTSKVGSGATPKGGEAVYKSSGIPLVRSMYVHFDGFRRDGLVYIDEDEASLLSHVEIQGNDVLFNITGASIGRVTTAPADMAGARVNQHVCILRATDKLMPRFLSYYMRSPDQQVLVWSNQIGGTRQAVTKVMLLNWDIPLPTLTEQERIVKLLDEADELRKLRAQANHRASNLVHSLFHEMFGDIGLKPGRWPMQQLGRLATIEAMLVDPRAEPFKDLPHVGANRIERDSGNLHACMSAREDGLISAKFLFDERDVLYSKIRPNLRKAALPIGRGLCSADIYPIRRGPKLLREFLWAYLLTDHFTDRAVYLSARANMPKLNRVQLDSIESPVPPLPLQKEFAARVSEIRAVQSEQAASRRRLDDLFQSMLHRAFNEEL
jgi:type I restriction enzyme, S subunit